MLLQQNLCFMEKKTKERRQINEVEHPSQLPQERYGIGDFIQETAELLELFIIPFLMLLLFCADGFSIWWIVRISENGVHGFWNIVLTVLSGLVLLFSAGLFGAALND